MKTISRKINKYNSSTLYRDNINANALGLALLALLGLVLLDGYINTLILGV